MNASVRVVRPPWAIIVFIHGDPTGAPEWVLSPLTTVPRREHSIFPFFFLISFRSLKRREDGKMEDKLGKGYISLTHKLGIKRRGP